MSDDNPAEETGNQVPAPEPRHFMWLKSVAREMEDDYRRIHAEASGDIQRAGHAGESSWGRFLKAWLPPAYEVGTRKYVVPEVGNDCFETDLVVFRPSYPAALRAREEVLAGGVAAAFSVKLTLDAAGIRDAVERGRDLKRSLNPRLGTPRDEMLGVFPFGLLAHSHVWKRPGSDAFDNISANCRRLESEICRHPRELLDYICVADLSTWCTLRLPYIPPHIAGKFPHLSERQRQSGYAVTAMAANDPAESPTPIGSFMARMLGSLSVTDSTIRPLADSFSATGTLGQGRGPQRIWDLAEVFSEDTIAKLPTRGGADDGPWAHSF